MVGDEESGIALLSNGHGNSVIVLTMREAGKNLVAHLTEPALGPFQTVPPSSWPRMSPAILAAKSSAD